MNLYQAEEKAKREDLKSFVGHFPSGDMKCTWIDPHFGFFEIEGLEGFVRVQDIDAMLPYLEVSYE